MASAAYSLKRRLLLVLLGTVSAVWIATAIYSYLDARHEVNRVLDAHLAQSASLIVAQVAHEMEELDYLEHAPELHERTLRVAFQIWERGTVLRLHSLNAPNTRFSPRGEGFSDAVVGGKRWRVFSAWDDARRYLVQVAERDEARREIATGVVATLLVPLVFALPALGLLIWVLVVRALKPLNALGHGVEKRAPDDMAPLEAPHAPAEVLPLVRSLNALFGRVTHLIENERRFTADAAHELRTPLAALKTQAQVARGATDDAERRRALDNVIAGCDRAARLVEQLLTLARLEAGPVAPNAQRCDLRAIAQQAIADAMPAARAKAVDLELHAEEHTAVRGACDLLAVLARNLLDNAIRYSPRGARVLAEVTAIRGAAVLTVVDNGPGIPREAREHVGQRFYRVLGTEESGSGLGFSIVKRIAEIHGASVALGEAEHGTGLKVTVSFAPMR